MVGVLSVRDGSKCSSVWELGFLSVDKRFLRCGDKISLCG